MRRRSSELSAGVVLLVAASVSCAGLIDPVALDFRIVPQDGVLPGAITDLPGGVAIHRPITSEADRSRRFEVQYRLRDLDPLDDVVIDGLLAGTLRVTATDSGAIGTLSRARLSRFEAQTNGAAPPASIDTSGLPTGALSTATGLHFPYRGGIPSPAPNNLHPSNGTITEGVIEGIVFARVGGVLPNTEEWYGLYSFEYTAINGPGVITFSAACVFDVQQQASFSYYANGAGVPRLSGNSGVGTASVEVVIPTAATVPMFGFGLLLFARRRRRGPI